MTDRVKEKKWELDDIALLFDHSYITKGELLEIIGVLAKEIKALKDRLPPW
jgi:hypothetical protein